DGSNVEDLVTQGLDSPNGIAIGIISPVNPITETEESTITKEDVNGDGVVDVNDLVIVAQQFGKTGANDADVNGDEIVNVDDFILVAAALENAAAAPAARAQVLSHFTEPQLQGWLTEARASGNTSHIYQRGIDVVEQLLALFTPVETALLANYPNPFNPETWIPYQLSEDADVMLHIYAIDGTLVRTLPLGHQAAGVYQNRSRAAYWDGRNAFGEKVASGVYFYTLTAGDFSATRKMLIRK
ncbi:T9SS type A sorting domain-containing protein, partial [Candidatus Poribacteria bacterium]|nr:T9SS type A sorting domain-containing protein [Candidatus Poribacteria bacterium]